MFVSAEKDLAEIALPYWFAQKTNVILHNFDVFLPYLPGLTESRNH